MPKQKTRKSAAKRFKQTGTGKYRRRRANARHLMTRKNAKRKRRLRKDTAVTSADERRIRAALPNGL
jgi:large subunit ribosomal protein L35